MSLSSLSLISPDFPWWIFIFITFHTISVNGTIGFLREYLSDLSLFVYTIRLLAGKKYAKCQTERHTANITVLSDHGAPLKGQYSFKIYRGLCLTLTMECLSISLPLSLTLVRIILYSYIRLWEIPWELGIIKDGIYCFIMYIRAKAICTSLELCGLWELRRGIKQRINLVLFLIPDYCGHFAWNGAVGLVRKLQG